MVLRRSWQSGILSGQPWQALPAGPQTWHPQSLVPAPSVSPMNRMQAVGKLRSESWLGSAIQLGASLLTNNDNSDQFHGCDLIGLTLPDGIDFGELVSFYSPKIITGPVENFTQSIQKYNFLGKPFVLM